MTYSQPAGARLRPIPWILAASLLVAVSVIAAALGSPMLSPSTAASPINVHRRVALGPPTESPLLRADDPQLRGEDLGHRDEDLGVPGGHLELARKDHGIRGGRRAALGEADGVVPDGTTVFDAELPGVVNLDPDLLDALRRAARDAAQDGVQIVVESGWRSPTYQDELLREAVSEYGSEGEASRWVATADTSPHVSGEAVDIGPFQGTAWLSKHGAEYGLCQIFRNEPWHYELRPQAVDERCPRMYANPTHDPRMR